MQLEQRPASPMMEDEKKKILFFDGHVGAGTTFIVKLLEFFFKENYSGKASDLKYTFEYTPRSNFADLKRVVWHEAAKNFHLDYVPEFVKLPAMSQPSTFTFIAILEMIIFHKQRILYCSGEGNLVVLDTSPFIFEKMIKEAKGLGYISARETTVLNVMAEDLIQEVCHLFEVHRFWVERTTGAVFSPDPDLSWLHNSRISQYNRTTLEQVVEKASYDHSLNHLCHRPIKTVMNSSDDDELLEKTYKSLCDYIKDSCI